MDYLLQFIRGILVNPEQADLVFALLIGLGAMLAIGAVGMIVLGAADPARKRVDLIVADNAADAPGRMASNKTSFLTDIGRLLPFSGSNRKSPIRKRLIEAGYESSNAPATFQGLRFLLTLGLPLIVFLAAGLFPKFSVLVVAYAAAAAAAIGFIMPGIILENRASRRQQDLLNGFPDALDLLVACTEAGLGLNAALQRVAEQMVFSHPALAHQFVLVNFEIRGGVDRITALRNLYERTGLDQIRGLVSIMAQTLRFGTSIADTLRIFAEDMRDRRMQAAEEQAAKIGTKLIFPLIFCIFPCFFLVAIGPAVIGIMRSMF